MSELWVDKLQRSSGIRPVDFPLGFTIAGQPHVSSQPGTGVLVDTEAKLDTALAQKQQEIVITGSFTITSQKNLYYNLTIRSTTLNNVITASAALAVNAAFFKLPSTAHGVILSGLNLVTVATDVDGIYIENGSIRNEISNCFITTPSASARYNINIDGQKNRIYNNHLIGNNMIHLNTNAGSTNATGGNILE